MSQPDTPGVRILPPFLFMGSFVVGMLIHLVFPIPFSRGLTAPVRTSGVIVMLGAIVLMVAARLRFIQAGTNVNPMLPVTSLVLGGPYRFTRNPMYVGLTLFSAGLALLVNAAWPMLLLIPTVLVLQREVILREERLLEAKFGDEYRDYRKRVRRWF